MAGGREDTTEQGPSGVEVRDVALGRSYVPDGATDPLPGLVLIHEFILDEDGTGRAAAQRKVGGVSQENRPVDAASGRARARRPRP